MATWSVLCKSLLKGAGIGTHAAKSGIKFAVAHPKTSVAGLAIALPVVGYKKGLVNFATEKVFGKGNEGKGISPLLKKTCDEMLTIPMVGHVQSLNASVAASILLYEISNK